MRVAIEAAQFTPDEADALRRAMATFRRRGTLGQLKERMVGRMVARGYEPALAERCFRQIEGFGDYGFPGIPRRELRACWPTSPPGSSATTRTPLHVRCSTPSPWASTRPAQIVRDAREHGVDRAPGGRERERLGQQPGGDGGGRGEGAPRSVLRAPPRHAAGGRPAPRGRGAHRGGTRRALSRCRRAPPPRRHPGRCHRDPGGGGRLRLRRARSPPGTVAGARAGQGAAAAASSRPQMSAQGEGPGAGGRAARHGGGRAGGRGLPHAPPLAESASAHLPARPARRARARSRPRRWPAPTTATARRPPASCWCASGRAAPGA